MAAPGANGKARKRRRFGVWLLLGLGVVVGGGVGIWGADAVLGLVAGLGAAGFAWGFAAYVNADWDRAEPDDDDDDETREGLGGHDGPYGRS